MKLSIFYYAFRIFRLLFVVFGIICNIYFIFWTILGHHIFEHQKIVYNSLGFHTFRGFRVRYSLGILHFADLGCIFLWEYGHSWSGMSIFPKDFAVEFDRLLTLPRNTAISCFRMLLSALESALECSGGILEVYWMYSGAIMEVFWIY